jgi:hypothetical protein
MKAFTRKFSWTVSCVLVLTVTLTSLNLARASGDNDDILPKAPRKASGGKQPSQLVVPADDLPLLSPATGGNPAADSLTPNIDDGVRSVWIVPKRIKANKVNAAKIRAGEIESIELRYYTHNELPGADLVFMQVLRHAPGRPPEALGGNTTYMKDKDGKEVEVIGLNYGDYQESTLDIKKHFDQIWGPNVFWKKKVPAGVLSFTGGVVGLYAVQFGAKYLIKKEIGPVIIRNLGRSFIKTEEFKAMDWVMGLSLLASDVYGVVAVYNWLSDVANDKIFGQEELERDWLHRLLSKSYDWAKNGRPIPAVQAFGEQEVAKATLQQAVGQDAPAAAAPSVADTDVYRSEIQLYTITNSMGFAATSLRRLFTDYLKEEAADSGQTREERRNQAPKEQSQK